MKMLLLLLLNSLQIHGAQINRMVDVTVVVEDIVALDLDHGLNEFSNSFSSKKKINEQKKLGVNEQCFIATNCFLSPLKNKSHHFGHVHL